MRKTVVDGSNPSGFQRTLLIAHDGHIETSQGKVGIASICLEEDSARILKQTKDSVSYRLDRLGIPLVEIATKPDIKSPEQAREVAFKLGQILRSCNVKRGIGTIRQDVNMSISKGTRVEIKGVQELALISRVIEKEIVRQLALIGKNKKVKEEVRKALADGETEFLRPLPGAARMYPETDLPLVHISVIAREAEKKLPKLREEEQAELERLGINREIASQIVNEGKLLLFRKLLATKAPATLIANVMTQIPKSIEAHHKVNTQKLTEDVYREVLEAFYKEKIVKDAIELILVEVCEGEKVENTIKKFKVKSKGEVEKIISELIRKHPQLKENSKALVGIAMKELRGRADGKLIFEVIEKLVK